MYWMISRSLLPSRSMLRTSLRRSSARPAFESASVWFWHTRQRSSTVMRCMRASISGSAAAGAASLAWAAMQSSSAHAHTVHGRGSAGPTRSSIELFHEGLDARLDDLGRQRPDVLHADHAALVDDEGLGHAVHAEVDADPAVAVERRHVVRVAELAEPAEAFGPGVLVVEADDRDDARARK